ncbi:MAG: endonuclease MutS2 [Armatimonadota bacterium]
MDEHALRVLEFDKIIKLLQEQAACTLGREAAASMSPSTRLEIVREQQQETSEAKAILQYEGEIPLGGIEDIREHVKRARIGAMLKASDLLAVQNTLAATRRLAGFLSKLKDEYPILGNLGAGISTFEKLEDAISRAISQSGEVLDSASPRLARIRSELRSLQTRLTERMNAIIHSREYRAIIQQPVVTIRNDRYCVPIKSEYRGAFPGIVHDASVSGATVFVEPASVVELGNQRKEMMTKERDEVEKVLTELSVLVGAEADEIMSVLNIVAKIDCITARAKLGIAMDAVEPVLNDKGEIELIAARHPLLTGYVVPIDVNLGKSFSALLITGPNTGGKTVSLKTIGLLCLMAMSGFHIPAAAGSEVAVFENVFADIGDEQSIEQSLSTFSAHMSNIVHITEKAEPNSLILLDEIGAGTDPAEGAALAKAILDYLIGKGARVVATTHYGELKEFAYLRDEIENACVEFDPETLKPTYKLVIGIPGSSNAFAIASRLGLEDSIVQSARANLARGAEATGELIRRIEETHRVAAEQRRLAEVTSRDVEMLRRRYEERLADLEAMRDKLESKAYDRAQALIDTYRKRLDRTLEQLATQTRDSRRTQELRRRVERIIAKVEEQFVQPIEQKQQQEEALSPETELKYGTRVRVAGIDRDGIIVEPPQKGKVVVMIGSMRVTVSVKDLRRPRMEDESDFPAQGVDTSIAVQKAQSFSPELHLRGLRVESGLIAVAKYLDDAITVGADRVRIIHGKGTGQMRSAVHEYLKSHPAVASFKLAEPSEGGSGVTVVEMRK